MSGPVVYFIRRPDGCIKIGTSVHPKRRLNDLSKTMKQELVLLTTVPGTYLLEKTLHRRFGAHRLDGEWFYPAPEILAAIEDGVQPIRHADPTRISEFNFRNTHTREEMEHLIRCLLADLVDENQFIKGRMVASEFVGERCGVSGSWVRKILNRNEGVEIAAHEMVNVMQEYRAFCARKIEAAQRAIHEALADKDAVQNVLEFLGVDETVDHRFGSQEGGTRNASLTSRSPNGGEPC